ncbi:Glutathione-dependent formaldehyde-activating, GFA [Parvularcula bermudensis HTCC2503]|uniref:Glutathione-dependent formaldehyde-activating, GFA n=1 Tax=Parvularcula bermudensis (strain ATCC BAA-594 / HTCC2503 / KCTC 12087) TaxID=314260 RepID=E0TGU7_PARBH|nr:GFA family protein [Parvularcula bermudensis]ADM10706.1 Glutathione-dependent formaldehyde-activating, GFA [Parvularcula bermudensis HTCC2503]
MAKKTGSCLCGAVRFTAEPEKNEIDACHCGMCRKTAGGPVMAVMCGGSLQIEEEAAVGWYQSSDWGERGFCKTCGSSLFWRLRDKSMTSVHAGAFDDVSDMTFTTEIFVDSKPTYYAFAGKHKMMTEADVMKAFSEGKS